MNGSTILVKFSSVGCLGLIALGAAVSLVTLSALLFLARREKPRDIVDTKDREFYIL